jgi:hypothetical protein
VVYENTDAFDAHTGKPLANTVLHPDNVKSIQLI